MSPIILTLTAYIGITIMNLQRSLRMGSLALAIAFSVVKPGYGYQPPMNLPTNSNPQSSSFTIAQLTEANSPVYGTWKLQYSVSGIVYESILTMRGRYGSMRTKYFQPDVRRTVAVDQTMSLKSSANGLILLGSNPVYAGTSTRHPTYSADNFLFQIRPDGTSVAFTCDYNLQCSPVDIEVVR
ncbi:RDD domain-containing protein [Nostoc sp. NIES-2111]|nr:RDD domain-containing protein [Nostoc sp. NIES-2111]